MTDSPAAGPTTPEGTSLEARIAAALARASTDIELTTGGFEGGEARARGDRHREERADLQRRFEAFAGSGG